MTSFSELPYDLKVGDSSRSMNSDMTATAKQQPGTSGAQLVQLGSSLGCW
jgi:hypothetical protein